MIEVDLNGPDGNVFAVMGLVKSVMKDLSESQEDIKLVMNEMMSGDYEHLIATAEKALELLHAPLASPQRCLPSPGRPSPGRRRPARRPVRGRASAPRP